jgi:hypothetical protein
VACLCTNQDGRNTFLSHLLICPWALNCRSQRAGQKVGQIVPISTAADELTQRGQSAFAATAQMFVSQNQQIQEIVSAAPLNRTGVVRAIQVAST